MQPGSFPVHDPRAGWRSTLWRRFVLLLGWLGTLAALGSLVAASQIGALWAWALSPAAAGFSMTVVLVLPEPRPVAPPRPQPNYLLADQRLDLRPAGPTPEPVAQVIDAYRRPRPLAVPSRQAA